MGTPANTKTTTISVCNGSAKTALLSKNKLTQQKIIGVVIQVLYGLSRFGSLTRKTMSPRTVRK